MENYIDDINADTLDLEALELTQAIHYRRRKLIGNWIV